MTTQLPYQQQQPPPPAYPTAPPWAIPPVAEAEPSGMPEPPPHGGLLVPFPEEMQNAARPRPPAWWPVIIWTFFFSLLALISVARRANMAQRGRNSVAPYWIAWGVTVAVTTVLSVAVTSAGVPAYLSYREGAITEQLQENIVKDGTLKSSAQVSASSATCGPVGPRDVAGERAYDCLLVLEDGRTGTLAVMADDDGTWSAVPAKKK